jgi:glycyl-tRNA synthetase
MHSGATKTKLVVRQALDQPIITEVWEPILDRKKLGPKFKGDAKALVELITGMSQVELENCKKVLEEKGEKEFKLEGKEQPLVVDKDLMQIERVTKKETSITPDLLC